MYRLVVVVDKTGGSGVVVPATFGIADVMAVVVPWVVVVASRW